MSIRIFKKIPPIPNVNMLGYRTGNKMNFVQSVFPEGGFGGIITFNIYNSCLSYDSKNYLQNLHYIGNKYVGMQKNLKHFKCW